MTKGDFLRIGSRCDIYYVVNEPSRLYLSQGKSKIWVNLKPILSSSNLANTMYDNVEKMRQERLLEKEEVIKWIFSKHRTQEDNKYSDLSRLK